MSAYPHLFARGEICGVSIANRIVQAPMGTGLAERGRVTDLEVAFHEERARGGVGLLITGAALIHPTSMFPGRTNIELWDDSSLESLQRRVVAVQRHGTRIFGQIVHVGRESPLGAGDSVPMAPSAVPSPRDPNPPHEMTAAEVRTIMDAFVSAATLYQAAGYDGLELHAAHGYLLAQFLSPASNHRTDAYRGDTLEGRVRLLSELVERIRDRCGADYPIGVRLSGEEQTPDGLTIDDTREIVATLQATAPVDYFSITAGMRGAYVKDATYAEGFTLGLAAAVKQDVDVPVIATSRIRFPELAERAIASGQTDFVGLGRALVADPEWPTKAKQGRADQIRPCVGIVQDCRAGVANCAVNARAARENDWPRLEVRNARRRVVVVGAGPAGLEAARVAAASGHGVVVYEKAEVTGGQLRIAAAGPTREEILDFVFYAERELARFGVDVRLHTTADPDMILADSPDMVVVATGATPETPGFPVGADAAVVSVWDLLGGRVKESPEHAAVLDDGGGFWHGISAAEFLAERGAAVELLTPARAIGLTIPHESLHGVHQRLRGNGVRFRPFVRVTGVRGTTVVLADTVTGEPSQIEAELLVVRSRLHVNDELLRQLEGRVPALVAIGDCSAPRRLSNAVLDANRAVHQFNAGTLGKTAMVAF